MGQQLAHGFPGHRKVAGVSQLQKEKHNELHETKKWRFSVRQSGSSNRLMLRIGRACWRLPSLARIPPMTSTSNSTIGRYWSAIGAWLSRPRGFHNCKRRNPMNYTKPEVTVLGEAVRVIEVTHIKDGTGVFETPFSRMNPDYALDE